MFALELIALLLIPPVLGWVVWRQQRNEGLIMATLIERLAGIETALETKAKGLADVIPNA